MRPFRLKAEVVAGDKASKVLNKITASANKMANSVAKDAKIAGSAFSRFQQRASLTGKKVRVTLNNLNARVNRVFYNINKKFGGLGALGLSFGAGYAIKKTLQTASAVAKVGDEAAKTGRLMGISAESLQEFRFAADRQGVSAEMLDKSLIALQKRTGELKSGTGSLYAYLNKTGSKALLRQLRNVKGTEEAFNLLQKAIADTKDPTQKAALASNAFSRSGIEMLKFLEAGEEGIKGLREEARKYGGVISNEAAAASEKFVDAQTNMRFALKGLTNTLGSALMPEIQKIFERITEWIAANREVVRSKIESFAKKVGSALSFLAKNAGKIVTVLKIFAISLIALKAAMAIIKVGMAGYDAALWVQEKALNKATRAQWKHNLSMLASPFTWIVIAIVAVVAAIGLLIYYWKDIVNWVKTSNNWFAKLIRAAIFPLVIAFKTLGAIFSWISEKISQLVEWVKTSDSGFAKFLRGAINGIIYAFQVMGDVISWISTKFSELVEWVKTSDSWFAKFIRGAIDFSKKLLGFLGKVWNTIKEIASYAFKVISKLGDVIDYFSGETQKELGVKIDKKTESKAIKELNLKSEDKKQEKETNILSDKTAELVKGLGINSKAIQDNTKANQQRWKGKFSTTILKDMNVPRGTSENIQKDLAVSAISKEVVNNSIQKEIIKEGKIETVKPQVVTSSGPARSSSRKENVNGVITVNVVNRTGGKFGLEIDSDGVNVVTTGNQ